MSLTDSLALLNTQATTAYLRHAGRPQVQGNWGEFFHLWQRAYEAKAVIREQNPVFAAMLLPRTAPPAVAIAGLPLLPAGVRAAVDDPTPGAVALTLDIAGTITLRVTTPSGGALTPAVSTAGPRATASFLAPADGLYQVQVLVNNSIVATIYVPVQRAEMRRFREQSRALAFAFVPARRPQTTEDYASRLALLIAADAAAATGQPALYAQLATEAALVPLAKSPVALFPRYGHP